MLDVSKDMLKQLRFGPEVQTKNKVFVKAVRPSRAIGLIEWLFFLCLGETWVHFMRRVGQLFDQIDARLLKQGGFTSILLIRVQECCLEPYEKVGGSIQEVVFVLAIYIPRKEVVDAIETLQGGRTSLDALRTSRPRP